MRSGRVPETRCVASHGQRNHSSRGRRTVDPRARREIDLLVTDVVMPQMGGKELAYWLRTVSPKTRVLFMSGYTDRSVIRSGELNPGTRFLQKPYPLSALASEVRGTLDA